MDGIYKIALIVLGSIFLLTACKDDNSVPSWQWEDSSTEAKPRYIWIDAAANFPDYANSRDNITRDLTKVKDTGFTDIVVDVRPSMGDVLFQTSVADQVKKLDVWEGSTYTYYERTATWDYLQAFIDIGHELGLKVHAAINTFIGGNKYPYGLGEQGMLFRDASKKEWATTLNLESGLVNVMDVTDDAYGTKFLNAANEDVQNYILALLSDLAKYDVDGIFLDRCRYDDLTSDFSNETKKQFEQYIGESITHFPDDIMLPGTNSLPDSKPKYLKKWLEFRAKTIHDFIVKAHDKVKSINKNIQFGVYVGGWYSTYYESGVNWASPKYNTFVEYSEWATADYKTFGYADHLDFLLLGAYASADKVYGNTEWTMQGFCKQAKDKLQGDVKFAGGPDVGNWSVPVGINLNTAVTNTVDACINSSDGYFVFDIVHVKKYNYWDELKSGIDAYLKSQK
ncbi:alpha amylase family protein [uncultured Bacteroides sp.]|uniref:alpha amylase family protein n=1 Tax=uncultured Bacteroides sp. TaxID=162156 RepID=UPI002AA7B2B7|nr:alpha amylase family protein [uncultured Bacteroides sp.]